MHVSALRKLHSVTALVPLSAYVVFHTWEHWPARLGRDMALTRMALASSAPIEILAVLLPLVGHAVLGLRLSRIPDASRVYASPAFRTLQAITGVLSGLFLVWHVGGVWLPRAMGGQAPAAYSAMLDQAGPVVGMALYVLGISAVCVHLGQGLGALALRSAPGLRPVPVRGVAALIGALTWLAMINVLAAYASGAALL